ncbi:MAG: DUF2252 domain-containing protein [Actinomycetota bacterium]
MPAPKTAQTASPAPDNWLLEPAVAHLSPEERSARGKAARSEVTRASHGEFSVSPNRIDPIELLEGQAQTRVPELVPIRYGRMLVSPFTFFRGAALIMASDLAGTPRSGLRVQLCGDAHLSNFGGFGTPERSLIFDLNDFDETLPGPWEWDLKRLTASLEVAGRDRGFSDSERDAIVRGAAAAYREAMRDFAQMGNLEVWYSRLDAARVIANFSDGVDQASAKRTASNAAKARTKDSHHVLAKMTEMVDGQPRIISDPPLIMPARDLLGEHQWEEMAQRVRGLLAHYRETMTPDRRALLDEYQLVDIARKVVGVGSVGTRAWIALMLGRDGSDPLFLQIKEAQPSVLEDYLGTSVFENCGERVIAGQRIMQAASDVLLGWNHAVGLDGLPRDFYVRQLKDWKVSAVVEVMAPPGLGVYGRLCAWTLARAHARSGDRIAIAGYLGKGDVFDRAIADFSVAYADVNERDYKALEEAVSSGRIVAQSGL